MPNSSGSSAAGDSCSKSKSTNVTEMETGAHVLEVKGYSGTKGLSIGKRMDSGVFSVAGHR
jgi:speckle-type POZ protein